MICLNSYRGNSKDSCTSSCSVSLETISTSELKSFNLVFLPAERISTRRKTKLNDFNSDVEIVSRDTLQEDVHESFELPLYEFKQIIAATDNFSYRNKLGEGGFGPVYKGEQVAVKRLSGDSGQGIEEFKNEIVLISKLQHRNLVKLLGCCIEGKERLLIYEYMTNKSLDTFLFDPKKRSQLDWATRFNIIQGIGRGLIYLHRDSCLRIIHRDLKCGNILLDEKMNPKIADFGLARNFQMTQELANTLYPLAHAWKSWKEGRGEEFIDQALARPSCLPEGLRCIHVGLLCVQDLAKDRPTMTEVVSMLCSEIDLPEPKEPLFTLQRLSGNSNGQESANVCSNNVVTLSMVEGR
nr:G-type lectin S-receptor-like serine/threonine-protein kinase At1g61550 [Tanacetum cinerariifolium]